MGSACIYVSHVSISYFCTQIVMNHIVNGSSLTWVFGFMVCLFLLMPEALHKTYCKTVHARSDFCSFPSGEIIVRMVDLFLHPSSWLVCFHRYQKQHTYTAKQCKWEITSIGSHQGKLYRVWYSYLCIWFFSSLAWLSDAWISAHTVKQSMRGATWAATHRRKLWREQDSHFQVSNEWDK